jgi:MFS family permease
MSAERGNDKNNNNLSGISSMVKGISEQRLLAAFYLSGVAALIYQVTWQRLLFGTFGVDIDSVTIVVSTFMLGLGVGSLVGGQVADLFGKNVIIIFACCEIGIGVFGISSPYLIALAGDYFVNYNLLVIGLINFALILIPTTLMGATLPMLVSHLFRTNSNVGISIGSLYFSNTRGAAFGAFATGLLPFMLSIDQMIYLAAAANFMVAIFIYLGQGQRS